MGAVAPVSASQEQEQEQTNKADRMVTLQEE